MKAAILGGSFSPPHVGHLALAETVCLELGYDTIFFIPAFVPPHKKLNTGASTEDRIEMLKKSIEANPAFKIELCEIEREGVSYTIDTVDFLERKFSQDNCTGNVLEGKLGVILGDDLVDGFSSWKNAKELSERVDLILACRHDSDTIVEDFVFKHKKVNNAYLPISSSDIRERIAQKKAYRYLVSEAVYEYISTRKLYE